MISVELAPLWQEQGQQSIFRHLLECNSQPGVIANLGPWLEQESALLAVLATLLDSSVTIHDLNTLVTPGDRRRLNVPDAPLAEARFIVADGTQAPPADFQPHLGTLDSPELGATVILQGQRLGQGRLHLDCCGPGILGQRTLYLDGFDAGWFTHRAQWVQHFPLGAELILVDATQVVFLPRTTRISMG
ncbi:phosphonate C-P lyase system protein PhnH [Synechococcus sp. PCC 6716]|nr:phosphonate C-P lyase system protein PhnH [Synechococcus sp. PCC 6716]